jgi:short chain dehydrogenase
MKTEPRLKPISKRTRARPSSCQIKRPRIGPRGTRALSSQRSVGEGCPPLKCVGDISARQGWNQAIFGSCAGCLHLRMKVARRGDAFAEKPSAYGERFRIRPAFVELSISVPLNGPRGAQVAYKRGWNFQRRKHAADRQSVNSSCLAACVAGHEFCTRLAHYFVRGLFSRANWECFVFTSRSHLSVSIPATCRKPTSGPRRQCSRCMVDRVCVTKAALPYFRERKAGHFVQFSSMGGRIGPPGRGPYSAAKWGIEGFSEVLSRELARLGIKVTIIEPGGFCTDFGGSSTKLSEGHPEYDSTVGATARFQRAYNGKQPGDPKKAAQAIVRLTQEQKPPLRLLLGSDAYNGAEKNDLARLEEARAWKELSLSTDF